MHQIAISTRSLGREASVDPRAVDELLGEEPCRTVKSVLVCRDEEGGKLLLEFDRDAERADDVAALSTVAEVAGRARRDGAGVVRIPIDLPDAPVSAREVVTARALTELYGPNWRTARACRTVERVRMCRDEDNTTLVLMVAGQRNAPSAP